MLALALSLVLNAGDAPLALPRGPALLLAERSDVAMEIATVEATLGTPRPGWILLGSGLATVGFGLWFELFAWQAEDNSFPRRPTIAGVRPTLLGLGIITAGVFAAICAACWAIFTRVRNSDSDRELDVLGMRLQAIDDQLSPPGFDRSNIASASGRVFKVPFVYRAPEPHPL